MNLQTPVSEERTKFVFRIFNDRMRRTIRTSSTSTSTITSTSTRIRHRTYEREPSDRLHVCPSAKQTACRQQTAEAHQAPGSWPAAQEAAGGRTGSGISTAPASARGWRGRRRAGQKIFSSFSILARDSFPTDRVRRSPHRPRADRHPSSRETRRCFHFLDPGKPSGIMPWGLSGCPHSGAIREFPVKKNL